MAQREAFDLNCVVTKLLVYVPKPLEYMNQRLEDVDHTLSYLKLVDF